MNLGEPQGLGGQGESVAEQGAITGDMGRIVAHMVGEVEPVERGGTDTADTGRAHRPHPRRHRPVGQDQLHQAPDPGAARASSRKRSISPARSSGNGASQLMGNPLAG